MAHEPKSDACAVPNRPDASRVTVVAIDTAPPGDYLTAMRAANRIADEHLGTHMLLSRYDRDRDFESPQHASECHSASATPGYVDYTLHRGASLKVDFERGRFVFYCMRVEG